MRTGRQAPAAGADGLAGLGAIVGDLLRDHPGLVADFHILPTRGRPASTLLPPGARTLLLRQVEAEGA
jgi:hypothetical protein